MLTETQKAYLAGLIDGEGAIMVNQAKCGSYELRVQIGMVDSSSIEWGHQLTRLGHIHVMKAHYSKPMSRSAKRWTCAAQDGYKLLILVLPYLIIKRRQAELYIELANIRTNRTGKTHAESRTLQAPIAEHIKLLNKRGA